MGNPFDRKPFDLHGDPRWRHAEAAVGAPGQSSLKTPLGDPTRWGGAISVAYPAAGSEIWSEQILQAQTVDAYARSWSLTGTLTLSTTAWAAVSTWPAAAPPYFITLEILQGVGQRTITQELLLTTGASATIGMCNTQAAYYGGPYFPRVTTGVAGIEGRSFAAIGALIGHSVSVRAHIVAFNAFTTDVAIEALLTPYAAGAGI